MGKPDAPTPPDPYRTAAAATGTNVATGVANAFLNNVNQVTPQGSLTYAPTDSYSWNDPTTGQTYNIPRFTATQTLSPTGQAIQGQSDATRLNLAAMANQQSQRVSGLLSNNLNLSGAPTAGSANAITGLPQAATSFASGGPIQSQLGAAGDITKTYGPEDNFSADRSRVEEALYGRLNPQLAKERGGIEQRLADQGIRYGSQAYTSAMDDYNRQANDLRLGVTAQGGQEQQRMNQMAQQLARFQNAAQQQGYEQTLGAASFANQAQGQQFGQNAAQATFGNAGLAQQLAQAQSGFNAAQSARNQYMQEQYAQRNQPINEITSLMSGSQINQPNFINTPGAQIPTTDVAGLINNQFNQQMGVYQQQNTNYNTLMGGILGLGAGALKASDRRMKENVDRIATVFAADSGGEKRKLPIYQYSYKDDPASTRHVGPMAQEVEKITPDAVSEHGGRKFIDTDKVMGSILRAA